MLADFLAISRNRRANTLSLAKLQIWLLEEIANNEKAIKHYKSKLSDLDPESSTTHDTADTAKSAALRESIEGEIFFYRLFSNVLRIIGDGIAWRAFRYDRATMRALGQQASNQTILSDGLLQELTEWSRSFDRRNGLAILNSLTNAISVGDVTIVHSDGSGEIVEVKSGTKKSGSITRQKQKMRQTVNLLSEGKGQMEDTSVEVLEIDLYPENDQAALYHLLNEASENGSSASKVSDYCYLECSDIRNAKWDATQLAEKLDATRKQLIGDWEQNNDFVLSTNSLDILAYTPNSAPFSIFPFPAPMCVGLSCGAITYSSYFNVSSLCRLFEKSGWTVQKSYEQLTPENSSRESSFLELEKDGFHSCIAPAETMRMQMELIRPDVYLRQSETILDMGPQTAPKTAFVVFKNEGAIWD